MERAQGTPKIFICYAHQDNNGGVGGERWLDRLRELLYPLELTDKAEIWSDQDIELGEDWHSKIQDTLQQVQVAVLLVSPAFLASRYIRTNELPVLLMKAKAEGVIILPILLRECLWRETLFRYPDPNIGPDELSLSRIQMPTTQPLNGLQQHEQDRVLCEVAKRISNLMKNGKDEKPPESIVKVSYPSENELSRAELRKLLNALSEQQFNQLQFDVKPPKGIISSNQSQSDRVIAFLEWAESPTGCGLERIQKLLNEIIKKKI